MAQNEQVLVVATQKVKEIGLFHGLMFDIEPYTKMLFAAGALSFMPRLLAEKDPACKQIIPYVIISCNGRYLTYVRGKRAGETRLVGNRSIGIGGHINPVDDMPLFGDPFEMYKNAVEREIAEEINIQTSHKDSIAALLNDDTNEVGQVHLGIVHHWKLDEPKVERREQMITQLEFKTAAELIELRSTMETWSQLCTDGLEKISARR